ncbi:hypothetical protein [Pseudonocardia dioxanivorans]|uniref:hypothetical protein n=1 Tax=Pseudonocardia dioxanivorans TaxID=240495 RepID=UPI000CCFFFE0|nr:hypothetical protein [Pseudonocardia dioxanivorans]
MTRPIRLPDGVAAPQIETVLGVLWWIAGALALSGGSGTVLMAAGLGVAGGLWTLVRRRHGSGLSLGPARRARLVRQAVVAGALALAALVGVGMTSWSELAVPLASALVAIVLFSLSTIIGSRSFVLVGGLVLVLSAVGAVVALGTMGSTASQGLVGFGGALVFWVAGALRAGLVSPAVLRSLRLPQLSTVLRRRTGREPAPDDDRTGYAPAAVLRPAPPVAGSAAARPAAGAVPSASEGPAAVRRPAGPVPVSPATGHAPAPAPAAAGPASAPAAAGPAPAPRQPGPPPPVSLRRATPRPGPVPPSRGGRPAAPARTAGDPFGPTVRAHGPARADGQGPTEPVRAPGAPPR